MRRPSRNYPKPVHALTGIAKCPTGIQGLDEITLGGLPRGRPTLVCGSAGCGKSLLSMEFLLRGALEHNEPGVCLSFEESAEEFTTNVSSLGFDVASLVAKKKLLIDHVDLQRNLIEEAGEYDLEAFFVRLGHAVKSIGAKRVVIDSIEALFAGLQDEAVLRSELRRLFRWLKDHRLTAIITGERGAGALTRHGLEEYISDCVILLDHQVTGGVLTRRLRIVKYRGSTHGTNEYPFLIEQNGISVLPVTSVGLSYRADDQRVSTGIPALDEMFGGEGYFRGSSILISGTAGTGKTSVSAYFVDAGCGRGERCLFFSFEESANQIIRDMRSIGLDLQRWVDRGRLVIQAAQRATLGLEMHLVKFHRLVSDLKPAIVVIDPATAILHSGSNSDTESVLLRLVDFLKANRITSLMTALTSGADALEHTPMSITSLVDTWLLLRDLESAGERNRGLYILKSRGLAHSNQIREFHLTNQGVQLRDVYIGDAGMLTGSARVAQEAREQADQAHLRQEDKRKRALLARKQQAITAQIAALRLELESEELASQLELDQEGSRQRTLDEHKADMTRSRSLNIRELRRAGRPASNGGKSDR